MVSTTTLATSDAPLHKYGDRLLEELDSNPDDVRVIVMTDGAPTLAALEAKTRGGEVIWEYRIIDGFAVLMDTDELHALAERSDVLAVHLDVNVTGNLDLSHRAVEANKAWDAGFTGAGVSVAVLDTGIDQRHSYLRGVVSACVSIIRGEESPECEDTDGHGSHVSGIVASRSSVNPGIAPEAQIAAVRVLHALGAGWTSDVIAGMQWVQENKDDVTPAIRVANLSLGPLDPQCGDDSHPSAQAANALAESGVLLAVAAGNSGHDTCTVDGAAAASNVLTVGSVNMRDTATQEDDVIAASSSGGPTRDGRIKPDVAYPGVRITSAFIYPFIATMSGTSMAAPHAAGTAALLFEEDPTRTWDAVKQRIMETAVQTDNTGAEPNSVYGHGLGNACNALQLADCRLGLLDTDKYVTELRINWEHVSSNHHTVTATAVVVNGTAADPVAGAEVNLTLTSPAGVVHETTETTDADGTVTFTVFERHSGHGEWGTCVEDVYGTDYDYRPNSNDVTCTTRVIDH